MPSVYRKKSGDLPAPCRNARNLLMGLAVVTSLLLLAMGADLLRQPLPGQAAAEQWMHTFSLSGPALWTAGSPTRHPETIHPGIDLRLTVGMESLP